MGMGPPWGAFCQITLTSCYFIGAYPRYEVVSIIIKLLSVSIIIIIITIIIIIIINY